MCEGWETQVENRVAAGRGNAANEEHKYIIKSVKNNAKLQTDGSKSAAAHCDNKKQRIKIFGGIASAIE